MTKTRGRGRPAVYVGPVRKHIVKLIRLHNASGARRILNARGNSKLAKERDLTIVPKPLGISMPTLLKIGQQAEVSHPVGRPLAA